MNPRILSLLLLSACAASEPRRDVRVEQAAYGDDVRVGPDEVVEDVNVYMADAVVEGRVLGNVTAVGGDISVRDRAVVDGDVVSFGGDIEIDPGAVVSGDRIEFVSDRRGGVQGLVDSLYHRVVFLLTLAGAGVLAVGLVPARVGRIAASVDEGPFRSFVAGALGSLLLGGASLLFALTIIGLPISFVLVALLGLGWLTGFVGLCQAVGDRLPFRQRHHGRWVAFLVGCLLVSFLGALPWVGWLVVGTGSLVGVGGALRSRFGTR